MNESGAVAGASVSERNNSLAIGGFVASLLMWIPIPALSIPLWVTAVALCSVGLSRSNRLGLPQRGLAIAGLCICLLGVLLIIAMILILVGLTLFWLDGLRVWMEGVSHVGF